MSPFFLDVAVMVDFLLASHCRSGFFQSHGWTYILLISYPSCRNGNKELLHWHYTRYCNVCEQRRNLPKRRAFKRMIYGFAFSTDELEEWGRKRFGDTDDEKVLEGYMRKWISPLFNACYRADFHALCYSPHGLSPPRVGLVSHLRGQYFPRLSQEKSSTGWRRTYASRKILNGIGFTVVEGLLSNQGTWPYVEWPFPFVN